MTTLTEKQRVHFETLLQSRDAALRADIRREIDDKDDYQQMASEAPDSGDMANATLYTDLNNAAVSRGVDEMRDIEAARRRLNDGTYGHCADCGLDIPRERLEVQPTALRCTSCQEQYEKTYALPARPTSL